MKKPMDELEVLRHLMLATTHRQTMVRKYGAGIMDRLQRDRLILLTETGLYKVGVRGRERLEELLAMPDDEPEAPLRESSKEGKRRYPGRLGSVVKGEAMSDDAHLARMSAAIEHMAGEIVSTPDADRPWNPCLNHRRAAAWMDVKRERLLRRQSIGGKVYWMPTNKGLNWLLQQDRPGVHAICLKVRARLDDMERQATRGTTDKDPHLTSSINPAWEDGERKAMSDFDMEAWKAEVRKEQAQDREREEREKAEKR